MFDSDRKNELGEISRVLFDIYNKLHSEVDKELMRLDQEDLRILQIVYGNHLTYPIHEHIDGLLDGPPAGESIH